MQTFYLCFLLLLSPIFLQAQDAKSYYKLGQESRKAGNYTVAIDYFTKALKEAPQYWEAYAARGFCKARLKAYPAAIIDYNVALGLGADDPLIYLNRGWANYNLGDKAEACQDWKMAQSMGYHKAGEIIRSRCP